MQPTGELLDQLRGVTGPETTPAEPPTSIAAWLIAGAVIAGLLVLAFRWRRRPAAAANPRDDALRAIERLPGVPTLDALHHLDEAIRLYLSRTRPHAPASLATPELLAALPPCDMPWLTLLELNDRRRFAGELPSQAEWSERLRQAATLVQAEAGDPAGR